MLSPSLGLFALAAYLIGAIPFGYMIARLKGVDLFQVGSGNIGASNVGRVLGRKWGIIVFVLDFLKGAGPVAAAPAIVPPVARITTFGFLACVAARGALSTRATTAITEVLIIGLMVRRSIYFFFLYRLVSRLVSFTGSSTSLICSSVSTFFSRMTWRMPLPLLYASCASSVAFS